MNNTSTHAVMYLRARSVGTDGTDRKHEETQIDMQRQACMRRAEEMGVQLIREYAEYGGTGPISERPELRLMLDELTALHDVRYVITTSLDRLARRTADLHAVHLATEAAGAELILADGTHVQPFGELLATIGGLA